MTFTGFDICFFVLFFALVVGISMYKSRNERTSEDYFLASRGLSWWLIGFSIVAANISTEQFVGMAGQGAGAVGLAVSNWQLIGAAGIVLIAFTLLPRFLKAGIYTMPEFLEYRYNAATRAVMALITVVIYVSVLLTAVLYSGGIALRTIFGLELHRAVWIIAIIAGLYTTWGGLKAVAWADLFQGAALMLGGLTIFFIGLNACGGWEAFSARNADRLHMILKPDHAALPWTGVFSGMWIVTVYYCGLNQFIVQRTLAARTLRDGQTGVIFAAALWLLVPFAIVLPGILSFDLYGSQMARPDEAFPTLIRNLIPQGLRGFIFAAISGAVISSLASMLNSASTIFTMDIYHRMLDRRASQKRLVFLGRLLTLLFLTISCWLAPMLDDPKFGGVFQYIQQYQGYIWPGVTAVFLFGIFVDNAPGSAGVAGLVSGPVLYGLLQSYAPGLHFLIQVAVAFQLVLLIMGLITFWKPRWKPRPLPVRRDMDIRTEPKVKWLGAMVIAGVALFYIIFW
ncbi:solute:sodium symporter family transporter [bacterium]|nr:solute:sodium symporter family transporter [bacterium]